MNRWQQQQAIIEEFLQMEARGEAVYDAQADRWELTEKGKQRALDEIAEDYGIILAPIIRLYDRLRAWFPWLPLV
jgi:hypothetical protein